jgi:hypothetical protein
MIKLQSERNGSIDNRWPGSADNGLVSYAESVENRPGAPRVSMTNSEMDMADNVSEKSQSCGSYTMKHGILGATVRYVARSGRE